MAINVKVVEAPNAIYSVSERFSLKIFIAGGISGCRDWQRDLIHRIIDSYEIKSPDYNLPFKYPEVTLYNPRRKEFDIRNSSMEDEQVSWEYENIDKCDLISFWFSDETIQPITLLELGKVIGMNKPMVIGVDDDYERKGDVEIQLRLAGFTGKIHSTIKDLSRELVDIMERGYDG